MHPTIQRLSLLACCGLPVHAVLAQAGQLRPTCYFWEPPDTNTCNMPPEFAPMVRVVLSENFTDAATAAVAPDTGFTAQGGVGNFFYSAKAQLDHYRHPSRNWTPDAKVCV
jgi:hypothetical protein